MDLNPRPSWCEATVLITMSVMLGTDATNMQSKISSSDSICKEDLVLLHVAGCFLSEHEKVTKNKSVSQIS